MASRSNSKPSAPTPPTPPPLDLDPGGQKGPDARRNPGGQKGEGRPDTARRDAAARRRRHSGDGSSQT
jgi:hypothetical protein